MSSLDRAEAVAALESLDFQVDSITLVSERRGGGKEVFRATVTTDSGEEVVFVKGYPGDLQENIEMAVSVSEDIGLPNSYVVPGSPTVLITERTVGRPLSRLFPALLLPGVWYYRQSDLTTGISNLGRYLGNLHSIGPTTRVTLREGLSQRSNYLEVPAGGCDHFDAATIHRIEELFETAKSTICNTAICHSDLSPHNIYYSTGDVELIDFGFQRKPAVVDLVLTELGISLMIRRLPYARTDQLDTLLDEFRTGYRATNGADPPQVLFHALTIGICLRLLERYATDPKTIRARLTKWTDRPIITRLVRESLDTATAM